MGLKVVRSGAGFLAFALAACSGGSVQNSLEPTVTTVSPSASTLQFAIGTANIGGQIGLNSLETLRQTSAGYIGESVLTNAPTITGPAGFVVPNEPDAYSDAGTNHISGILQTSIANYPTTTTFSPQGDPNNIPAGCSQSGQCYGIATSYGIEPAGVVSSSLAPDLEPYALPFYASAVLPVQYIGGPPAFVPPGHTSPQDGSFPVAYPGYTLGFVAYQAAPVVGAYTLSVIIPTGVNSNGTSGTITKTATSTLKTIAGLPAWSTPPTFTPDGNGGGTIATNFAGGGITEEYLEIVNLGVPTATGNEGAACQLSGTPSYYYTIRVTPGAATASVPDDIGAARAGVTQPHTFCTASDNGTDSNGNAIGEDMWMVYGFAVDYPLQESAFPKSDQVAAPAIVGSTGQDDVTASFPSTGPASSSSSTVRRARVPREYRRGLSAH